jgi:hypothetical protein
MALPSHFGLRGVGAYAPSSESIKVGVRPTVVLRARCGSLEDSLVTQTVF